MRPANRLPLVLIAAGVFTSASARAADTVETWDVGATDVDFYMGFDGLNAEGGSSFGDIMLGYGILEGFSTYLGTTLTGDENFGGGATDLYLGIFGTPIDTAHVDLDLFLQVASGSDSFAMSPGIELNLDADPSMQSWGGYVRTHLPVSGRSAESANMAPSTTYHVALTFGAYRTISARHQVLVEYQLDVHPEPMADQDAVETGGVAVGYNVLLTDSLELITQLHVDAPRSGDEPIGFGVMTGFIATLPAVQRALP